MGRWLAILLSLIGTAAGAADAPSNQAIVFPPSVSQGALVLGKVAPGSEVRYADRILRVTAYGTVVFGIGREEKGPLSIRVRDADGRLTSIIVEVTAREWPLERVDGVPPKTVDPPPAIAERIRREQARVADARNRDDARADFAQAFVRPVEGRISGRFGNQRVYNGTPGTAHSGMDIAAPSGTPVKAPAAGIITFAEPDLYLTGGTVLIDHGHGVSTNFLHLSRIDVNVGDRIEQAQVVGAVGATGRASGPHLHWGMNWFDVRVDPQAVLELANRQALAGDRAPRPDPRRRASTSGGK